MQELLNQHIKLKISTKGSANENYTLIRAFWVAEGVFRFFSLRQTGGRGGYTNYIIRIRYRKRHMIQYI